MGYGFTGWARLGLALGWLSCGSDPAVGTNEKLVEPDWTLTFLAPAHGSSVTPSFQYHLAISGPGTIKGEPLPFDIGFFANDVLVHRSRDTEGIVAVPTDTHALKVRGIDEEGEEVEKVLGDQIRIRVEE